MTVDHFNALGADLFGYGWQTRLAKALGVEGSTVRRWVAGSTEPSSSAVAYLDMLASRQIMRGSYIAAQDWRGEAEPLNPVNQGENFKFLRIKLQFPGVDRSKPMPSIHLKGNDLALGDTPENNLQRDDLDFHIVRHPDSYQLKGYLQELEKYEARPAYISSKHHYYSVIAFEPYGKPTITYDIVTHAGMRRTLVMHLSDKSVIGSSLTSLPGVEIERA